MNEPIYVLNGVGGQLEVFPDRIGIKRKGVLAKMNHGLFKGDKTIMIKQISAFQVKKAGLLTNGYIQFTLAGGNENTKGLLAATHDENSVVFAKKYNQLIDEIEAKIRELMNENTAVNKNEFSVADEIVKLKKLLDDGILTQQEFDNKKKKLLENF